MRMKKLFTLTILALLMAVNASAQDKKTWDFTKGLSDETVTNLTVDTDNWSPNGTDKEGNTNNWQNAVKPSTSDELKANGEVIKETAGLLFDIGNNKSNSIHIAQDKIRLTRANTTITFPKLSDGQTVTIVGRSANGTATDRGIAPVQGYLQYDGDDSQLTGGKCIFLGNQVENSLGTYSFRWKVVSGSSDPVDVQFKLTPNAGIDFTLFMIDSGDEVKQIKVAYLYDGVADGVLAALQAREATEVTAINVSEATITADELIGYDVTVIGNVPADNAAVNIVKAALPFTPTLNLNANLYGVWGYGVAVPTLSFAKIKSVKNALFSNVNYVEDPDEGNVLVLADDAEVLGLSLDDYFQGDEVLATSLGEEPVTMIHSHNINHNGYLYLPYVESYSESAVQTLYNALTILSGSKQEITAAALPTISQEFKDHQTIVSIAPGRTQPKTQLYYTIDGSEPTVETATLYTEPFVLTAATTVKAAAIAEGYTLSSVAEQEIVIYSQPKTPTISFVQEDGKTVVTVDCESSDAQIWYNFETTASTDTVKSSKYTEPFTIIMPQNVNVFAVANETVWSEVATQRVLVQNPRVVIDVAAHFSAPAWDGIGNGTGLFSGGKKATSMYVPDSGQKETIIDPETGDEIEVWTNQEEVESETKDEPGEAPQWTVVSKGQAVLWQNNGASTDKIGTNEGGYYPETSEDVSTLFPVSKNDIQFAEIFANEHANASIQSKNKYQAPLDIVVIANMQGGPLVAQVSADGVNWTTVGDEIEKTGWTRMWKMYTRSYDGTDEVYVRVAQETGSATAKIFDIYVANQGEKSLELLAQLNEELTGIASVKSSAKIAAGIYSVNGIRQNGLKTGLNIVVEADGTVKKIVKK